MTKDDKSDLVKAREGLVEMGFLRDSGSRRAGSHVRDSRALGRGRLSFRDFRKLRSLLASVLATDYATERIGNPSAICRGQS
jgi:hypothetical protein